VIGKHNLNAVNWGGMALILQYLYIFTLKAFISLQNRSTEQLNMASIKSMQKFNDTFRLPSSNLFGVKDRTLG